MASKRSVIVLTSDFGIYVVNLFDTFHASKILELGKHSLAYLLKEYCDVSTNKKFQLADWRIRPLSSEMILYARTDTHYLLYIFDRMRNEIVSRSGETLNLLNVTLQRSAETSLKTYEKQIYDANGEGSGGWKNLLRKNQEIMNNENMSVFKAIHGWRDFVARREDESTAYILSNHNLLKLARFMPTTASDVISGMGNSSPLIRIYAQDISEVIDHALLEIRNSSSVQVQIKPSNISAKIFSDVQKETIQAPVSVGHVSSSVIKTLLKEKSSLFGTLLKKENTSYKSIVQEIHSSLHLEAPQLDDIQIEQDTQNEIQSELDTHQTSGNASLVDSITTNPIIISKELKAAGAGENILLKRQIEDEEFFSFNYELAEDPMKLNAVESKRSFSQSFSDTPKSSDKKVEAIRFSYLEA
jgi:ribonuclease D